MASSEQELRDLKELQKTAEELAEKRKQENLSNINKFLQIKKQAQEFLKRFKSKEDIKRLSVYTKQEREQLIKAYDEAKAVLKEYEEKKDLINELSKEQTYKRYSKQLYAKMLHTYEKLKEQKEKARIKDIIEKGGIKGFLLHFSSGVMSKEDPFLLKSLGLAYQKAKGKIGSKEFTEKLTELRHKTIKGFSEAKEKGKLETAKYIYEAPMSEVGKGVVLSAGLGKAVGLIGKTAPRLKTPLDVGVGSYYAYETGKGLYEAKKQGSEEFKTALGTTLLTAPAIMTAYSTGYKSVKQSKPKIGVQTEALQVAHPTGKKTAEYVGVYKSKTTYEFGSQKLPSFLRKTQTDIQKGVYYGKQKGEVSHTIFKPEVGKPSVKTTISQSLIKVKEPYELLKPSGKKQKVYRIREQNIITTISHEPGVKKITQKHGASLTYSKKVELSGKKTGILQKTTSADWFKGVESQTFLKSIMFEKSQKAAKSLEGKGVKQTTTTKSILEPPKPTEALKQHTTEIALKNIPQPSEKGVKIGGVPAKTTTKSTTKSIISTRINIPSFDFKIDTKSLEKQTQKSILTQKQEIKSKTKTETKQKQKIKSKQIQIIRPAFAQMFKPVQAQKSKLRVRTIQAQRLKGLTAQRQRVALKTLSFQEPKFNFDLNLSKSTAFLYETEKKGEEKKKTKKRKDIFGFGVFGGKNVFYTLPEARKYASKTRFKYKVVRKVSTKPTKVIV